MKNLKKTKSGQTLIEVTVALTILSMVLTGVIFVFSNSLSLGFAGRDRTQATNLAQQTLEAVRMIKEEKSCTFFDESEYPSYSSGGGWYDIEYISNRWSLLKPGDPNHDDMVTIDPTSPYKDFKRKIFIETPVGDAYLNTLIVPIESCVGANQLCADQVRKVTVKIAWESKGVPGNSSSDPDFSSLTDWQVLNFVTYLADKDD